MLLEINPGLQDSGESLQAQEETVAKGFMDS